MNKRIILASLALALASGCAKQQPAVPIPVEDPDFKGLDYDITVMSRRVFVHYTHPDCYKPAIKWSAQMSDVYHYASQVTDYTDNKKAQSVFNERMAQSQATWAEADTPEGAVKLFISREKKYEHDHGK